MRGLIWKDTIHAADIDVIDGREDGLWWDYDNLRNTAGRRKEPIRFGVLHHQGGEGQAKQCFGVLNERADPKNPGEFDYLSVHFEIDQDGVITQMADLDTVCHQASGVNAESWGVEIASLGVGTSGQKYPRESYTDMVNGTTYRNFLKFFPMQVAAAYKLCVCVNGLLGLPLAIPMATQFKARRVVLSPAELAQYRGLIAHYMVTAKKKDPSPHLMDELAFRFAMRAAGQNGAAPVPPRDPSCGEKV